MVLSAWMDRPLALIHTPSVASLRKRRKWERKRRNDRVLGQKSTREKDLVGGLK
jgi:hypothetical protein